MRKTIDGADVLDHLPVPVVVCDAAGTVLRCNRSAGAMLDVDEGDPFPAVAGLTEAGWKDALRVGTAVITREGASLTFRLRKARGGIILHGEITESAFTARRELLFKREYSNELGVLFDLYIDENIWVTDGSGKTIFVSAAVANKHGIPREKLIGRYVQDLEREQVFSPSVTAEVLRTNRQSAVLQQTIDGRLCVAVGIPTYNSEGAIERVISITRDCASQIEIGDELVFEGGPLVDGEDVFASRFITHDEEMRKALRIAKLVAPTDSTILIEGETGVGKSLLAKLIHEASGRADGPFLTINCAVLPDNLFESELFGYASGSFTGADARGKIGLVEAANGGTLFLDEVEEMSLAQQVKLLEVIQGRSIKRVGGTEHIPVDVRILCAAKHRLAELVTASRFRMDLFYRLNVVTLHIPPLRDRKNDIPHLVLHVAARINRNYGLNKSFSPAAMEALCRYDYPGNVRELAHAVEQAMVTTTARRIDEPNLPQKIRESGAESGAGDVAVSGIMPFAAAVEQAEAHVLRIALETYGTKDEMAAALGVSRATLWRKLHKHGLLREGPDGAR